MGALSGILHSSAGAVYLLWVTVLRRTSGEELPSHFGSQLSTWLATNLEVWKWTVYLLASGALGSGSTIQITSCAVSLWVSDMEALAQLPFSSSGFQLVSHLIASGVLVVIDISYFEPASKQRQDLPTSHACIRYQQLP